MNNYTDGILWQRLKYVLSPQFDIYEQISKIVRGKVADIGFGTGFGTHLLSAYAKEVYAYEPDQNAVFFAQSVFPFKSLHFDYGDITKGINGQKFDFVIMIDVIEHIKDDRKAIENVKSMLTQNGVFICSTPNKVSRYRKALNHFREYTPKELETLLKRVFVSVILKNYRMESMVSFYENPILAICRNKEIGEPLHKEGEKWQT